MKGHRSHSEHQVKTDVEVHGHVLRFGSQKNVRHVVKVIVVV